MQRFAVTPARLLAAATSVSPTGDSVVSLESGAAAGTPAAGSWSDFAQQAQRASADWVGAREDLARALRTASYAYQIADDSAAASLGGSG